MSFTLFVEGGGESADLHARCRTAFKRFFERLGMKGRMPRIVACGPRNDAYDQFCEAFAQGTASRLLVDSEDPVADVDKTWEHLLGRDKWKKPKDATDGHVFLMTTCMETWIVADRAALRSHYGSRLNEKVLPAVDKTLEERDRQAVQNALVSATTNCDNAYKKGKRSFDVLEKINPSGIEGHLPSLNRIRRLLDDTN